MEFLEGLIYMLWRGFAIGVIISAPMGPVGILCVQRTLEKGRKVGLHTGIGAACSDLLYCLMTGFGLSFIEEFLERNQSVIQIIGSVVLVAFGIYIWRSNPSRQLKHPGSNESSPQKNILNGFLFTFSNPLIIFLIIGLFARFNFMLPEFGLVHYLVGFIGIVAGALSWWWVVTYFVDKVRAHFNLRSMWLINKIIGSIIFIFAIVGIVTAVSALANAGSKGEPEMIRSDVRKVTPTKPLVYRIDGGKECDIYFRVANLNNQQDKKYLTAEGESVRYPGWALEIAGGDTARIAFKTIDAQDDDIYTAPALRLGVTGRQERVGFEKDIRSDIDKYAGWNAFKVSVKESNIDVYGGDRQYRYLASVPYSGEARTVSFLVMPGGEIEVSGFAVDNKSDVSTIQMTEYGDMDLVHNVLSRSINPLEGIWRVHSRSLDDNRLKMGGDYRLGIIKTDSSYNMVYLGGASVSDDLWRPGMVKAVLNESGLKDIYNVIWHDATGNSVKSEIRAQWAAPLLTLYFVDYDSQLSLAKEK